MTFFAIEVTVQFLHLTGMVVMTVTIFGGAAAVLGLVYEMMLCEKSQSSEYGRLVHAFKFRLQIGKAERVVIR